MSVETNARDISEAQVPSRTRCGKCNGTGLVMTNDGHRLATFCCDHCDVGRLRLSRLLELLSDIDTPIAAPVRSEPKDSIERDKTPRSYS